jgi:class 3 adenylate cyclase
MTSVQLLDPFREDRVGSASADDRSRRATAKRRPRMAQGQRPHAAHRDSPALRAADCPANVAVADAQEVLELVKRALQQIDNGVVVCGPPDGAWSFLMLAKRSAGDDASARPGIAFPPRREHADGGRAAEVDRSLLTLLFTDIVGSTELAERLGDDAWEAVLARHNAIIRAQVSRFRGSEVDCTGDGFFATFDGPARAVRCAAAIREALAPLGLQIRAAVHCGECATVDGRVSGVAVHVTARMVHIAQPGEVLVSGTVRDLVSGSGLAFTDRDWHALRGLSGSRQLFALSGPPPG